MSLFSDVVVGVAHTGGAAGERGSGCSLDRRGFLLECSTDEGSTRNDATGCAIVSLCGGGGCFRDGSAGGVGATWRAAEAIVEGPAGVEEAVRAPA